MRGASLDQAVLDGLDQHLDGAADVVLGALGNQLVHQRGHLRHPVPDLVGRQLRAEARRLGAVLVGEAEHAHNVQPCLLEERLERVQVVIGLAGKPDDDVEPNARPRRTRCRIVVIRSRNEAPVPNLRIRRNNGPLACWKDRSKYGTTPGVDVITSTSDGRISAGCRYDTRTRSIPSTAASSGRSVP